MNIDDFIAMPKSYYPLLSITLKNGICIDFTFVIIVVCFIKLFKKVKELESEKDNG